MKTRKDAKTSQTDSVSHKKKPSNNTVFCSPQGGSEEHRAAVPVWRAGPSRATPGVHCALLGPSSRHHQQHPWGLDHKLLTHRHGALLPAEEEQPHYPHLGPHEGARR